MNDLQIVIPSFRRMPRQATLNNLPESWMSRTTLVLDQHDADLQKLYPLRGANILVHPPEIDTIAKKRAWIIMQPQFDKIVMFDDDLRFAIRSNVEETKLTQATATDLEASLKYLEHRLDDHVHAGWSARQGNNNNKENYALNTRMTFVLGYRCDLIRQLVLEGTVTLGRVRTREDMELCVQLLKLGHPNWIDFTVAADQVGGYGAQGGCSAERSVESSNEDAQTFADLHPGIVKVVEKAYKGSINRKEVIVYWKKAFGSSQNEG